MPGAALDEAGSTGAQLEIASYEVALDLTRGGDTFASRTRVHFRTRGDDVVASADVHALHLRQLALNGASLDVRRVRNGRLELPTLSRENELLVEAEFAYASGGEGLNPVKDSAGRTSCVCSKTNQGGASRVFCCFDRPDLRAPISVSVRAPRGWSCVANAPLLTDPPDDATLWRFAATAPVAPYQFSVCAGSFRRVRFMYERAERPPVPVGLWTLPDAVDVFDLEAVGELVREFLAHYERILVPYPERKCDLVFVPSYPELAFSAPGVITLQEGVLGRGEERPGPYLSTVIAHELAHAWIGGLTDLRHREDMWLQEALATYLSRTAVSEIADQSSSWETPTSPEMPDEAYVEDAATIGDLERMIGRPAVTRGLKMLLRRHRRGTVTKADLARAWSRASHRDLGHWAEHGLVPANAARPR